ncbi:hypothetical protein [Streptomyces sp. NPDC060198]|uniref:hypothetical protein n=1 Tax=Streptomyces sp. NPDC060198 TaxID=3347070 RepID=UPI00365B188C
MSAGFALPMVDTVAPTVAFAPPAPPVELNSLAHTGATHLSDAAAQASADLSGLAGDAVHQAADAALQVLGSLSGALLAGRAALAATRVLASAAVRAAEEQRCLERQEEFSALVAEQWETTAFAAARANARRRALLARISRSAACAGPGAGPPRPDLPPPLRPEGEQLARLRVELACLENAVRHAEIAQATWEFASRADVLDRADDGPDWQEMLRARRDAALRSYEESRVAADGRRAALTVPSPPADVQADASRVRELGADLLSALDPGADSEMVELAVEAVRHAVGNAHRARLHLKEARRFVESANRKAEARREGEERAAAQLDFLTSELPEDQGLPDRDPKAEALLHRYLDEGVALSPAEQELVRFRVTERHHALEVLYVRAQCARIVAAMAGRSATTTGTGRSGGGEAKLDWTPEGWGREHWLRATLTNGSFRVVTMRRATESERGAREVALDELRCAEARDRLTEFEELAGSLGLTVRFGMGSARGAEPGEPGADGAVVLDEARPRRREDAGDHRPKYRTAGGDDRW